MRIKNDLLILRSIEEFELAKQYQLFGNTKIIATSFACYYKLKRAGIECGAVWHYLSQNDFEAIGETETNILEQLWFPFFSLQGLDPYSKVPLFDLLLFLDEALAATICIRGMLQAEQPDKICFFSSGTNRLCIEGEWECTTFESVLMFMCEREGIKCDHITVPVAPRVSRSKLVSMFTLFLKGFFLYFVGLLVSPFLLLYSSRNKGRIGLSFVSKKERPRHEWIFAKFQNELNTRILHLDQVTFAPIRWLCLRPVQRFLIKKQNDQRFHTLRDLFYSFKHTIPRCPEILKNSFLDYQWDYLIRLVIELKERNQGRAIREKRFFNPLLIFVSQAHHPNTIARSLAFQELGVKTFLLPHAALPYNQPAFYQYHDQVLVTGRFQFKKLQDFGVNSEAIVAIEDGRYSRRMEDSEDTKASVKRKFHIQSKTIITVVTRNGQLGCGLFPKYDARLSLYKMYDFLAGCATLSDLGGGNCTVIFKSHPLRDYYDLYDAFASDRKDILHYRDVPPHELLSISDMVIFIGPTTDVVFEAAAMGKKIIICDCGLQSNLVAAFQKGALVLSDPKVLRDTIKMLMERNSYGELNSAMLVREFLTLEGLSQVAV